MLGFSRNKGNVKFKQIEGLAVLDFFNSRPIPGNAYRLLFIGDSLTLHGVAPNIWDSLSGMAASRRDKDFIHLFTHFVQQTTSQPVEIFYNNGGDGRIGSMLRYAQKHPELQPDMVVIQGGENDAFDSDFRSIYVELLNTYSCPRIVLGDWWSDSKSKFANLCANGLGIPFVNINNLYIEGSHSGDGGPYNNVDVSRHPNDKGMAAIAGLLFATYESEVLLPASRSES